MKRPKLVVIISLIGIFVYLWFLFFLSHQNDVSAASESKRLVPQEEGSFVMDKRETINYAIVVDSKTKREYLFVCRASTGLSITPLLETKP